MGLEGGRGKRSLSSSNAKAKMSDGSWGAKTLVLLTGQQFEYESGDDLNA